MPGYVPAKPFLSVISSPYAGLHVLSPVYFTRHYTGNAKAGPESVINSQFLTQLSSANLLVREMAAAGGCFTAKSRAFCQPALLTR